MTVNLADEIKEVEARSKEIVQHAKNEAVRLVNEARNESQRRTKEAQQKAFRFFRDKVVSVERDAEKRADEKLATGHREMEDRSRQYENALAGVSDWIAGEVISRYGS
ncbi:MAG TPA: cell envelope biogenesis protein TolA [Synergistaceae bacterium]|nr:cell envelope biogenesis protein TolA [Synergistaceae bacterium]